ncbi:MAG: SRPBCC family protein [Candidatus Omnitrophota bacterium]|jgi:carbon monoxide dehydrogenase subunit G
MKRIHLESSWIIRAPRNKVYEIITDFENAPKYFPAVAKSVEILDRQGNRMVLAAKTKAFFASKKFKVTMNTELRPPEGFISENISSLGVEHEVFSMEEVPEGTKINYVNNIEVKSLFFRILEECLLGGAH